MAKVRFVRVRSVIDGYGIGRGYKATFSDAEKAVESWLNAGWEFEGCIPYQYRGTGELDMMSLVFRWTKEEEPTQEGWDPNQDENQLKEKEVSQVEDANRKMDEISKKYSIW